MKSNGTITGSFGAFAFISGAQRQAVFMVTSRASEPGQEFAWGTIALLHPLDCERAYGFVQLALLFIVGADE